MVHDVHTVQRMHAEDHWDGRARVHFDPVFGRKSHKAFSELEVEF